MLSTEPAIVVSNLVKQYPGGTAVAGISFSIEPGQIVGLLGGNGAGKTTTIAMMMGLVAPTSGTIRILGCEMPHRLTIRQNLSVFARLYGVADRDAPIAALAADLDLTELLDRPTGKLSAGQNT